MSWPTGLKDVVYQLRAQGMTTRDIEAELKTRFPAQRTPDDSTIWRWLTDPEAAAAVQQDTARIRAIAAAQSRELVPLAYAGVRDALAAGDLKSADAGSRVIVNLTRGFIRDQIEVSEPTKDATDELVALLKRHAVRLDGADAETPTARQE